MKRFVVALFVSAFLFSAALAPAAQVGILSQVKTNLPGFVVRYNLDWICDSAGNVSGHVIRVPAGRLFQVKFYPGSGGAAPTTLYDVTLSEGAEDQTPADILIGGGANLSATAVKILQISPPIYHDKDYLLSLVVAAAGDTNSGNVILYIQQ